MRANLNNIAFILNEPHFPENIGAAARCLMNMGFGRLIVVKPYDCDLTRILRMATHAAEGIVADMEVHDDLQDALAPFQFVVGTTARIGSHRQPGVGPRSVAERLVEISHTNQIAVLFGTESRGLSNEDLRYCDTLVTIQTADFSSINLAQAVMILAYEISLAGVEEPKVFVPRLANRIELEGMYEHLKNTLVRINFVNPENPDYWMINVRRFFGRIGLRARDVKIIRGICRQIDWYCNQRSR